MSWSGAIVDLSNRGPWRVGAHNDILIIIINVIDEVLCCEGPNIWCYSPGLDYTANKAILTLLSQSLWRAL